MNYLLYSLALCIISVHRLANSLFIDLDEYY